MEIYFTNDTTDFLADTNVVMWKNGTTVIAQSVKTTNNRVSVDNNYTLTIHKTNEWDSQTYTCIIYPQELKVNAKLTVGGNQQSEKQSGTSTTPSPSSGERVSSTYFTFLLSSVMTSLLCANSVRRIWIWLDLKIMPIDLTSLTTFGCMWLLDYNYKSLKRIPLKGPLLEDRTSLFDPR